MPTEIHKELQKVCSAVQWGTHRAQSFFIIKCAWLEECHGLMISAILRCFKFHVSFCFCLFQSADECLQYSLPFIDVCIVSRYQSHCASTKCGSHWVTSWSLRTKDSDLQRHSATGYEFQWAFVEASVDIRSESEHFLSRNSFLTPRMKGNRAYGSEF